MVHCQGRVGLLFPAFLLLALIALPCLNNAARRIPKLVEPTITPLLSPMFSMGPGEAALKYYYRVDFPKGHIGIKSFNAEMVDEQGNSIPLYETYLHHLAVFRYYGRTDYVEPDGTNFQDLTNTSDFIFISNSGVCQFQALGQQYALGAETRQTLTYIPDPYAIEVGNPSEVPDGYEERWLINAHVIDTRGTGENRLHCAECLCELYNATVDENGDPLEPGYIGGLHCCYEGMQCKLEQGYSGERRNVYVKYTVKWLDWSDLIVPATVYMFDVTDKTTMNYSTGVPYVQHDCLVEYDVTPTNHNNWTMSAVSTGKGGYIVYAAGHQHVGGIGITLYGEDGTVLCYSPPIYGNGTEAGNEEGYIVGMTTCYPEPGTAKINEGENVIIHSNYSSATAHTGVMGLFFVVVAEDLPSSSLLTLDA